MICPFPHRVVFMPRPSCSKKLYMSSSLQWFVMRDLTRSNTLSPAYKRLGEMGVEFFTPMRTTVVSRRGVKTRQEVPFIHDLVFVHSSSSAIDDFLYTIPTLQYRFVHGGYRQPMVVSDSEMSRFIKAVQSVETPQYYRTDEITPDMIGREVRIVGGMLDGYEGRLLKCRGSRRRRLLVDIPNLLVAAVEVNPDYIVFL